MTVHVCGITGSLRMPGFVGEHAGIDPDLAQGADVFFLDVAAEDQVGIGIAVQPALVLDLGFQLSRRPPGIAERDDGLLRPSPLPDRLQLTPRLAPSTSLL